MELRRADAGDHAEMAELADLMVAAYVEFMRGPHDPYLESLRDVARRDREAQVWVATDREAIVGCVTWCPPGSAWREISTPAQGEFRMLAVSPAARGRGVGEALVRYCEALSLATGATEMVLSSLDAMTDAHRLYARLGYHRVPELDWDPNPTVHLIAYRKDLP